MKTKHLKELTGTLLAAFILNSCGTVPTSANKIQPTPSPNVITSQDNTDDSSYTGDDTTDTNTDNTDTTTGTTKTPDKEPVKNNSNTNNNYQIIPPGAKRLDIKIYPTYGNTEEVNVKGRVTKYENNKEPNSKNSSLTNLIQNFDLLVSADIKNISLDIKFNGRTVPVKTDNEGLFNIKIKDFGAVNKGYQKVQANLSSLNTQNYYAETGEGIITINSKTDTAFGIISDIDDTIQKSDVTNKIKALTNLLFKNYTTQEKIAGTSDLYQILDRVNDGNTDGDVYYVSGSPIQISDRIENFISFNNFPKGSIDLKKIGLGKGDDSPTQQIEYKLGKIRPILNLFPDKKFILFGDSGEKDPEIYKQVNKEFPGRIIATYINNVTKDSKTSERYSGQLLTANAAEAAADLYSKNIISSSDLEKVKQAVN
jgi:phosphatidate phosphatase APP1